MQQAVKFHRVARRRGSHIFLTVSSQMAVRLSNLRAGRPLHPGKFLVLISLRGWVKRRAIMWLEVLCSLKNVNHLMGNWSRDVQACNLVPQQLRYRVPYIFTTQLLKSSVHIIKAKGRAKRIGIDKERPNLGNIRTWLVPHWEPWRNDKSEKYITYINTGQRNIIVINN
jgi:hypothetical protein